MAISVQPAFAAGRAPIARQWLEWFRNEGLLEQYPQITVLGAWIEALWGHAASTEQWTALAETGPTAGMLPDGSPVEAWLAYLRAVRCRNGLAQMRADAQLAMELLPPTSPLRPGLHAKAYLSLNDAQGARSVLREMGDIVRRCPNLGDLPTQAEQLTATLSAARETAPGASSLTAAELRLVPYLATHLTFREIGERLCVSRHTVKTQAVAIYRKLGVGSRGESIDALRMLGLLGR